MIAFAQSQMGEPYVWGAEGPGSWDCSGLTMKAWQQAGVYLSHYTGAQWAETRHVPISARQPGDLVFYGVSGSASHHVGLYVGGDQMIEAPHAGANVRYASIWRARPGHGGRPALTPLPGRDRGRRHRSRRWRRPLVVRGGAVPVSAGADRAQRAVDMPASLARWRDTHDLLLGLGTTAPGGRPRPTCRARGPCRSRRSAGSPGGRTR